MPFTKSSVDNAPPNRRLRCHQLFSDGFLTANESIFASDSVGKPNIIMILVDDMGHGDLGCFGGPGVTPNIDRLSSEGLRFRSFGCLSGTV